jgi:hypothetical protein
VDQFAFDFDVPRVSSVEPPSTESTLEDKIRRAASDYQLQMQAYALAVRELLPSLSPESLSIRCTLHFLEPNVEFQIDSQLLSTEACIGAIDDAMMLIVSSLEPGDFPLKPANHCRMCNFLSICPGGREFVRTLRIPAASDVESVHAG